MANLGVGHRAMRVAGPDSQLPCHYVPAQPWLTEQKSGTRGEWGGGGWSHRDTWPHVCMYPREHMGIPWAPLASGSSPRMLLCGCGDPHPAQQGVGP